MKKAFLVVAMAVMLLAVGCGTNTSQRQLDTPGLLDQWGSMPGIEMLRVQENQSISGLFPEPLVGTVVTLAYPTSKSW